MTLLCYRLAGLLCIICRLPNLLKIKRIQMSLHFSSSVYFYAFALFLLRLLFKVQKIIWLLALSNSIIILTKNLNEWLRDQKLTNLSIPFMNSTFLEYVRTCTTMFKIRFIKYVNVRRQTKKFNTLKHFQGLPVPFFT